MKSTLLEKSFRILDRIASAHEPVTLKELAADLELNTSTVSRIASDLAARNLIRKFGYHSFVPASGLIRLGQAAMDTPLIRCVQDLIRQRLTEVKANAVFAAVDQGYFVPLYRQEQEESSAFQLPLWNSLLAAVILGRGGDPEAARLFFENFVTGEKSSGSMEQEYLRFQQRCQQAAADGCLVFKNPRFGWSVSFPVCACGQIFGVALYGSDVDSCNLELMQFECTRLASRITSALNALA